MLVLMVGAQWWGRSSLLGRPGLVMRPGLMVRWAPRRGRVLLTRPGFMKRPIEC